MTPEPVMCARAYECTRTVFKIPGVQSRLFVPGWGAPSSLYHLPAGWEVLELPTFRATRGRLAAYRDWLRAEVETRRPPVTLAGHSMGAALAVLVALDRPELLERLILVSPAGLPLRKPLRASAVTFVRQLLRGSYSLRSLRQMAAGTGAAPLSALALARVVHDLDLTHELAQVGAAHIPAMVIGCRSDALTTCAHCRRVAEALGAAYRELDAPGGHIWPVTQAALLAQALETAEPCSRRAPTRTS